MKVKKAYLQAYLDGVISPILVHEQKKEKGFPKSYFLGILEAVERIGLALDKGRTPKQAESEVDGMDLTGYMMGWAANIIVTYHPRGKEFQKYWNRKFGRPNAKGTINPAILTIEVKEKEVKA